MDEIVAGSILYSHIYSALPSTFSMHHLQIVDSLKPHRMACPYKAVPLRHTNDYKHLLPREGENLPASVAVDTRLEFSRQFPGG